MNLRLPSCKRFFQATLVIWSSLIMIIAPVAAYADVQASVPTPVAPTPFQVSDPGRAVSGTIVFILNQILQSLVIALLNAAQLFLGQLAYDAATAIATSGQGQQAVFYKKGFGQYLEGVASDALGELIGSMSQDFFGKNKIAFDLCAPSVPNFSLNMQLALTSMFSQNFNLPETARPKPKCDLKTIVTNWNTVISTMTSQDVFKNITFNTNAKTTDLGMFNTLVGRYLDQAQKTAQSALQDRTEGQGFKAVKGFVSGEVESPASLVQAETKNQVVDNPQQGQWAVTQAVFTNAFNIGIPQLFSYTASVFTNTLASKLMKRIFQQGISPPPSAPTGPEGVVQTSVEDTRRAFIDLKTPNLSTTHDFDAIAEMMACPSEGRGSWNCVMDQSLGQALQTKSESGGFTINQAMGQNLLHGDWKLIPDSEVKDNLDPNCFGRAYCVGNLRKMRLMRLIPVGFEFAANTPQNQARCRTPDGCVSLKEVVDGFFKCNAQGNRDDANPWCKLIDPTWVLSAVPQQCALNGFGDTLLSENIGQRREECQDVQTCLKRDDKGQCVGGYGYCLAERIAYRFGADECPAREASCRVYSNRAGQQISYLRNTLDYGQCNADNVGCLWYATKRDPSAGALENWIGTPTTGDKAYFDKTLESCPADQEGCTLLKVVQPGDSSVNFLANPSFERVDTTKPTNNLTSWTSDNASFKYTPPTSDDNVTSLDGAQSYGASQVALSQRVNIDRARSYTLSFYVRKQSLFDTADTSARVEILQAKSPADGSLDPVPAALVANAFLTKSSCSVVPGTASIALDTLTANAKIDTSWLRFECTFLSTSSTQSALISITGKNAMIDSMQLEESNAATPFVDGLNQNLSEVHMKVAPDEFKCSGADNDHAMCLKFAQVCQQSEAGCNAYTDAITSANPIPAILSSNDLCPQECVGYAEFRKQPTAFDLVADDDARLNDPSDVTPAYFIPSTSQVCKQEEVGCETFTNVEQQASGGEQQASFTYLRACEKPDPTDTETYYTWEGSDTTGYQLHTWSLKKTTRAKPGEPAPEVAALPANIDPFSIPPGPRILLKRAAGQSFIKDPSTCNEQSIRGANGQITDPDCRQFYDANGNIFYRYYSQTVLSTDSCTRYRLDNSNVADCQKTGGELDPVTNQCVYSVYQPESLTCNASAAGCRAFAGTGAGNEQSVLFQNFRNGQIAPFTTANGRISDEALLVGDKSLRLDNAGSPGASLTTSVSFNSTDKDLFRVSFYAKAPTGQATVRLLTQDGVLGASSNPETVGQITLTPVWQRFTVGLFNGYKGTPSTLLTFSVEGSGAIISFLDEISITKVQDIVYAKNKSWVTPAICDRTFSGLTAPQAMLGCRAYKDRNNVTVNARQFSNLCRQQAIGCMAFVDTRNSVQTGEQKFVLSDNPPIPGYSAATTTRPADRMLYLIDDPSKRCAESNASCRAFGKPILSADRSTVTRFETVYFKDDINKYSDALCRPSETFCEEYTNAGGSKDYFKDPQNHVCEYRTDVTVGTIKYDGYFVKGTDTPCYPTYVQNGRTYSIYRRGDTNYAGWAGLCAPENNECSEFRDPTDTTAGQTLGHSYYFLNNDKIDTKSCAGSVDLSKGCVLLRNMDDLSLKYSTEATYNQYRNQGFKPTAPIDCTNQSGPGCQSPTSKNDTNIVAKVSVDRDCAQWLGCSTAETVLDPSTNRYKDICSSLAICDQNSGNSNDIFCTNYINRSAATEPVLTQGAFFNINQYTNRQIGLGKADYSGYSIPNSYQVADMVNTRVAVDGIPNNRDIQSKYSLEYRLAAKVKIAPNASDPNTAVTDVNFDTRFRDTVRRYPNLKLCIHVSTKMIGYAPGDGYCYLPTSSDGTEAYDFQNLAQRYTAAGATPGLDNFLLKAFPPAECRAEPEQDSPFPASDVTQWDQSATPPKPIAKAPGLQNANTCEFGEDCSCTYKRVSYGKGAFTKFYSPYSSQVLTGVCEGGPRDGQSCIPDNVSGASTNKTNPNDPNALLNCGPVDAGGQCVTLDTSTLISGIFGQCLERDTTRTVGRDIQSNPCLTWNPTPVLFGEKDRYHYTPTAAYLPPENAGQYYCTSLARPPRTLTMTQDFFARESNTTFKFAGNMNKMYFDDHCNADDLDCRPLRDSDRNFDSNNIEKSVADGGDGYVNSMILGSGNQDHHNTQTAHLCANNADNIQDGTSNEAQNEVDFNSLRLVGTGKTEDTSYVETFFKVNPVIMGAWMNNVAITRATTTGVFASWGGGELNTARSISPAEQFAATEESNISFFNIQPLIPKTEFGRLGCGYEADWVDNLGDVKYDDGSSLKQNDQDWRQKFFDNWNPVLGRNNEKFFGQNDGEGNLYRAPCVYNDPEEKGYYPAVNADGSVNAQGPDAQRMCYFKYWEDDYRAEGQPLFRSLLREDGLEPNGASLSSIQTTPYTRTCTSDRPYFGMRAVFQASAAGIDSTGANKNNVSGPWRFVGFWTTSCGGKISGDYRHIYFQVDMKNASLCKQIAEVKSVDSQQDAAFTDRVWKESGYVVPGTGITYGIKNAPFSSALNTKPAGKDPLFQTGSEVAGFGKGKTPGFISSGSDSYFRDTVYPRDKWAYLSNLFARIYRIYRYYDQPVLATDMACVSGPAFGTRCTQTPGSAEFITTQVGAATRGYLRVTEPGYQVCSIHGVCDSALAQPSDLQDKSVCNSLSGINAGVTCANLDADNKAKLDLADNANICHLGPLALSNDGFWKPQFADCIKQPGLPAGVGKCTTANATAGYKQTFRDNLTCPLPRNPLAGQANQPDFLDSGPSVGCPLQVQAHCDPVPGASFGKCRKSDMPSVIANSYGDEQGECHSNADCSFGDYNYYLTTNDQAQARLDQWHAGLPVLSPRSLVAIPPDSTIQPVNWRFDQAADFKPVYSDADATQDTKDAKTRLQACGIYNFGDDIRPGGGTLGQAECVSRVDANSRNFIPRGSDVGKITAYVSDPFSTGQKNTAEFRRAPTASYKVGSAHVDTLGAIFGALFLGPFSPTLGDALNNIGNPELYVNIAQCERLKSLYSGQYSVGSFGRCRGGLYEGRLCLDPSPGTGRYSCLVEDKLDANGQPQQADSGQADCQPVMTNISTNTPNPACIGPAGTDPDTDQNICTHGVGYYPNPRLCPNPDDEYCGLIAYNRVDKDLSLDPRKSEPLPTDVTLGHYTPNFLGFSGLPSGNFTYIGYYTPVPPRIAAPDTRSCPTPGQCAIQKMDAFALNGLAEGVQTIPGGEFKSILRFYGWAAHNQMPLRKLVLDWGDNQQQILNDVKMKNKKPFCGVQKECWLQNEGPSGLTCEADTDCPAGTGTCMPIGYCDAEPHKTCALNSDCDRVEGSRVQAGTCVTRNFFGNSPDACETNYFEFAHEYTCNGQGSLPSCQDTAGTEIKRCSRDLNRTCSTNANCAAGDSCVAGLAPVTGCWDGITGSCRFTPRLNLQDNWGWCTGECRSQPGAGTQPQDPTNSPIIHRYGGCYSATVLGQENSSVKVKTNVVNNQGVVTGATILSDSECDTSASGDYRRPWIVYPGSIQLKSK